MSTRMYIAGVAWVLSFILTPAIAQTLEEKARGIHQRVLVLDTHIDFPSFYATREADPGSITPMQVDLPKMMDGGLNAGFFIVYVGQGPLTSRGYADAHEKALAKFDALDRQQLLYSHIIGMARSPLEVEEIHRSGRLVAMIGVENAYPVGPVLEHLQDFYDRGARYMSLTHIGNNDLGDSSIPIGYRVDYPEPVHSGLSDIGRQAIAEMNRIGIMIDVSHASKKTTIQATKASRAPVIASHSAVRKLHDIARNISKDEIKAIAKRGGVVQVVAFDSYLKPVPDEKKAAIRQIREDMNLATRAQIMASTLEQQKELRDRIFALNDQWPAATVSNLVDHIDYVAKIAGIDHVGIASDFGGGGGVIGWSDASETFNVTLELVRRGYTESEIAKIWGGNLLRVWREVEAVATKIQAEGAGS